MARATRSATTQEKEKPSEDTQTARKGAGRKRKRNSIADSVDHPTTKQSRMDEDVKEEGSPDPEETQAPATAQTDLPSSGDVPISSEDAEKILDILEMVDTQGLLDRVFPLSTECGLGSDSAAGPSTGTQSYSFRALLKSSPSYPLRVLRSAVQHLLPISLHPRSRPSATVAEQLRFCTLALSLLDQASFHSSPIPLDVESLLSGLADEDEDKTKVSSTRSPSVPRKYALVQKLPTGDWWSSLATSYPSLASEGKDLKDLSTAYADLVAVLPTPSSGMIEPPTLGAYVKKSVSKPRADFSAPRRITCGKYLNYGPYTSFAPVFEQAGVEVGSVQLGEVIWRREHERWRKRRYRQLEEWARQQEAAPLPAGNDSQDDEVMEIESPAAKHKEKMQDGDMEVDAALEGLLSPEQIDTLKATLGSLELEKAVQELLDRNARALRRLEELQLIRLRNGGAAVEVGSEEWETAQGIYDSLTVLASLRPRSSTDVDAAPLTPSASALHKLQRTLPIGKTEGWYGTLPAGRSSALRDDTTIHIRSGATVTTPAPPLNPPATTNSTPAPKTPGPAYSGYAYPGYTTSAQYRTGYSTYAPTQTSSYYANYNATTQNPAPSQYPSQYGTTGQQPYAYSSWYNYQPTPTAMAAPSGRATPQTPATPAASVPQNYSNYYPTSTASQQPQPQRAVANTVLSAASNKTYQPGAWPNGTTSPHVPPTLPPHLRPATTTASTPGTPTPVAATVPYQGYYAGNYQTTAASAIAR